ncbi:XRN2 [Symbiodinium pilosum]|uniref:XRN2 protein n=1 Tax=Symbiodinium pilosum TaxID=2952 RepID=A0A812T363_SYMPI|nr:XRN2 [Symbiodinium pilosum]
MLARLLLVSFFRDAAKNRNIPVDVPLSLNKNAATAYLALTETYMHIDYRLSGWICVRYPKVIRDTIEREPVEMDGRMVPVDLDEAPNGDFDNLYLDMNGIIHPCCHPEDGPAPEDEEHMYENIFLYLDRLFRIVRPKRLVYMAIDGVAPRNLVHFTPGWGILRWNPGLQGFWSYSLNMKRNSSNPKELGAACEGHPKKVSFLEVGPPKAIDCLPSNTTLHQNLNIPSVHL